MEKRLFMLTACVNIGAYWENKHYGIEAQNAVDAIKLLTEKIKEKEGVKELRVNEVEVSDHYTCFFSDNEFEPWFDVTCSSSYTFTRFRKFYVQGKDLEDAINRVLTLGKPEYCCSHTTVECVCAKQYVLSEFIK